MSVVPSVNASSGSVLPGFFGAPAVQEFGQESAPVSAGAESGSGDPLAFAEVLKQSSDSKSAPAANQHEDVNSRRSAAVKNGDAKPASQTENVPVLQQSQDVPSPSESSLLPVQIAALSESSVVTPASGRSGLFDESTEIDGNTELNDQNETEVAVVFPVIDRTDGAAIPIDVTRQLNASDTTTAADDDSELEAVDRDLLLPEQQTPDHNGSNRGVVDNDVETPSAAVGGIVAADQKQNATVGSASQPETESLQELRTSLEVEFGVQPDRNRQAGNRATVRSHSLQSRVLQNNALQGKSHQGEQAGSFQTMNSAPATSQTAASASQRQSPSILQPIAESIGQTTNPSATENSTAVSSNVAATVPVTSSVVNPLFDTGVGLAGEPHPSLTAAAPQRGSVSASQTTVSGASASDTTVQSLDQQSQLTNSKSAANRPDLASPETIVSGADSDSMLASSVTAGVASSGQSNAEGDEDLTAEESQSTSTNSDAPVGSVRQTQRVNAADTQRPVASVEIRGSVHSDVLPTAAVAGQFSDDADLMSAITANDDLRTALVTDIVPVPVVDSDLDLLQQLLPRETTTVFGQSSETSSGSQQESFDLPRQIAARAMGEAEVLETGDSSRFRMKLDPPELGSVMIEMQKTIHGTTITVSAADPATQQLLQDSLQQLNQSDSDEPSVFDHLDFNLSNGDQGDGQDRDSRRSQAEKIRIAGNESAEADSDAASQTQTELDFVA